MLTSLVFLIVASPYPWFSDITCDMISKERFHVNVNFSNAMFFGDFSHSTTHRNSFAYDGLSGFLGNILKKNFILYYVGKSSCVIVEDT
jgi:hypothetical protein